MVIQPNIQGPESRHNISVTVKVQDKLKNLKDKLDALSEMPEQGKLYKMAANMSAKTLEMATSLPDGDSDKEEAMDAVSAMVDATFELRELDNTVHAPNDQVANYDQDVMESFV